MALTTNTVTQAESICNIAVGQVVTDGGGSGADITFPIGFLPRVVRFVDRTNRIMLEWFEGMAANSAIRTIAAGTRTLDVASGITVNSPAVAGSTTGNSFTIKTADIGASASFSYEALG